MDRIVVDIQNLGKIYPPQIGQAKKIALDGVTLQVKEGETFGLLGPNGAGKTTLQKILLGLVRPSSGKAAVLGASPDDTKVRVKVGYLPENPYFYTYLTGREFVEFCGGLFGLSGKVLHNRATELLDRVGMAYAENTQLRKYSKGMLQRVGVAQALVNDPEIVFLDEPMSGLDPVGRREMRDIILDLKREGKTVFFNSHILSDVEALCDRVGILNAGRLVVCGNVRDLTATSGHLEDVFMQAVGGLKA
ncbi:MAG TPA: ABC transporter ATP-binding protein [Pantanalinema sp.]